MQRVLEAAGRDRLHAGGRDAGAGMRRRRDARPLGRRRADGEDHRRGARLSVTFTAPQPRKLTRLTDELTRPVDELACTFGEVTCTFGELTCAVVKLAGPVGSPTCAVDELTCTFGEVTCAVVELAGPVGSLTCAVDELTCAVDELTRTFDEVTCTVVKLAGPIGSLTCAVDELICVVNELICVVDELTRQRRLHLTARGGTRSFQLGPDASAAAMKASFPGGTRPFLHMTASFARRRGRRVRRSACFCGLAGSGSNTEASGRARKASWAPRKVSTSSAPGAGGDACAAPPGVVPSCACRPATGPGWKREGGGCGDQAKLGAGGGADGAGGVRAQDGRRSRGEGGSGREGRSGGSRDCRLGLACGASGEDRRARDQGDGARTADRRPGLPGGVCARAANEAPGSPPPVHCQKGDPVFDEVVKVGSGGSAFWIDRFEASVWQNADGTGNQVFKNGDDDFDILATFPKNGQWTGAVVPVYALSRTAVIPGRFITWFQANEACRASHKRLPTDDEWLAAARGTVDPGGSAGDGGKCVTGANAARATGGGTACSSEWGAEDMVGNVWEFIGVWHAGVGNITGLDAQMPWPNVVAYGNDATSNIASSAYTSGDATIAAHSPAVAIRGGNWGNGQSAGVFALNLECGPTLWSHATGFRCVVPR